MGRTSFTTQRLTWVFIDTISAATAGHSIIEATSVTFPPFQRKSSGRSDPFVT